MVSITFDSEDDLAKRPETAYSGGDFPCPGIADGGDPGAPNSGSDDDVNNNPPGAGPTGLTLPW